MIFHDRHDQAYLNLSFFIFLIYVDSKLSHYHHHATPSTTTTINIVTTPTTRTHTARRNQKKYWSKNEEKAPAKPPKKRVATETADAVGTVPKKRRNGKGDKPETEKIQQPEASTEKSDKKTKKDKKNKEKKWKEAQVVPYNLYGHHPFRLCGFTFCPCVILRCGLNHTLRVVIQNALTTVTLNNFFILYCLIMIYIVLTSGFWNPRFTSAPRFVKSNLWLMSFVVVVVQWL